LTLKRGDRESRLKGRGQSAEKEKDLKKGPLSTPVGKAKKVTQKVKRKLINQRGGAGQLDGTGVENTSALML